MAEKCGWGHTDTVCSITGEENRTMSNQVTQALHLEALNLRRPHARAAIIFHTTTSPSVKQIYSECNKEGSLCTCHAWRRGVEMFWGEETGAEQEDAALVSDGLHGVFQEKNRAAYTIFHTVHEVGISKVCWHEEWLPTCLQLCTADACVCESQLLLHMWEDGGSKSEGEEEEIWKLFLCQGLPAHTLMLIYSSSNMDI